MSSLYKLPPFPLVNNSSSCHFNAVLQVLLSCEIFGTLENNLVKIHESYSHLRLSTIKNKDSKLYEAIERILKAIIDAMSTAQIMMVKDKDITKSNIPSLSQLLMNILGTANNQQLRDITQGPQSACESLCLLIDLLGLDNLFTIKHQRDLLCEDCDHKKETEIVSMQYNAFDSNITDYSEVLVNEMTFESCKLDDYTCEICGSKNVYSTIWLKSLSEYIIVLFNKTQKKINLNHPQILTFNSSSGIDIKYRLFAQVEHQSDHYISFVQRGNINYICNDDVINIFKASIASTPNTYIAIWKKDTDYMITRDDLFSVNIEEFNQG